MVLPDIDLLDPDRFVRQEHHEMFRRLRAEDPVYWHEEPDGPGFWNVTKLDDLVEVNRDPELFSSELEGVTLPNMSAGESASFDARGLMMLMTDPPRHTRYRRLVSKGFTPRMIGMIEQYLRRRATLIVDGVIESGSCDFVVDVASELPLQAIAEIMGVPQEDRFKLFEWSNQMIGADDPEYGADEDSGNAAMELYAYSNTLAKQRRDDPRDDIITTLINAEIVEADGEVTRLTEQEFDAFMLLLVVAGNETTRNATAHGMLGLLTNPGEFAKLRDRREKIMDTAVDEIVRWATPVMYFRRTPREDTEIRGKQIKAGDKVLMWHISANRDEDAFVDPFRFDLERTPNNHVAFGGGGAHYCLGANLARMELKLIFDEVTRRIPDMTLAGEPERLRSNFIGGIKHLPVEFTPGPKVGA